MRTVVSFAVFILISLQSIPTANAQSDEAVFWQSISASTDPAEFCAYLEAFPNGKFSALAKLRVKKLGGACGGKAAPVPAPAASAAPTPAPATPRPTTPPATAEMEAAHKALNAGEIAMVGFPRATPPFSEFTIKQCFDCAEVQVICKDKSISGAHQLGAMKVAVMDWPTAGPTLGWVRQFSKDPLKIAPEDIFNAVSGGTADCAAFGGGMLRYGNWAKDQELAKLSRHLNVASPAPAASATPTPLPASAPVTKKPQRTGVGRYWAYVPMNDDDLYAGRIEYRSEYFQGEPVAEIGVTRDVNDVRLVWFFQDQLKERFGAGTGEYEMNVFLSDYTESDGSMPLDSILMLRDKERGCDYKNVSFCGIKCARAKNEFSYRTAADCKEISQPWYEFKAEMAEHHWKNVLTPAIYRSRLWLQPGGNNFYLSTEGLVEAICDNVKGADKYCDDNVRQVASGPAPVSVARQASADIEPMNEIRYTRSASNVRDAPGTDGSKLLILQEGQQVDVTGKVSGMNWYRIKLAGGTDGYVYGDLLTSARPEVTGASAPVARASSAQASSSGSEGGLPPISEANGPLCEFDAKANGWELQATFDEVRVRSMDAREKIYPQGSYTASGTQLLYSEFPNKSGRKEVSIELFNVHRNGEVFHHRLEGLETKHKYVDAEIRLAAGGDTTSVTAESHVYEFFVGGSSLGFDLPASWMLEKLRSGQEIAIDVFFKGERALQVTVNSDGFVDVFRHATQVQSKMASNLADGKCGFGASAPTASSGILGCTSARGRAPGNVEGVRFAVIPGSQKDSIKKAVKSDPRNIEIFDASMPVYETISNLGGFYEGVAFYDRDIRKRAHPIDGGPLVIGEMVNLPIFKQLAEQSTGGEFRCELLVAAEVCPHPKTPQASQPCN